MKSITIAIDASRAGRANPTGTELYSARLISELTKLPSKHRFILYSPAAPTAPFRQLPANWQWRTIPFQRLWSQLRLSFAVWQDRPDLLFVPAHVLPLWRPRRSVVTIHDVAYEYFPESYSPFERWYLRYAARLASRVADRIIVPSEATKNDLIKFYRVPVDKIRVTPLAAGRYQPATAETRNRVDKDHRPYFLMIGRLESRKNTALAIEAFGQFRQANPTLKHRLVLIGKPGYGYEQIQQRIDCLPKGLREAVHRLGYQDDATTEAYLKNAVGFLYPSRYEGFGFPLIEAMAVGTPIIASDISSIPEVVDDAAILVDPNSPAELAKAMTILATNEISGQQLAKRGRERAKQFNWTKTATQTLAILEETL